MGTFLSKKQSIEFGYLNKQLYIETLTQKQSYLAIRCNGSCFHLNNARIDRMISTRSDGFDYCFGKHLTFVLSKIVPIKIPRADTGLIHNLLMTLGCVVESIFLSCETKTVINNVKDLKTIFHNLSYADLHVSLC